MVVIKKIKGKKYETHVVSVSKKRATKIKKSLKKKHGKRSVSECRRLQSVED